MITTNLDAGGVENVVLAYARGLNPDRFRVSVACIQRGRVFEEIKSLHLVRAFSTTTRSRVMRFLRFLKTVHSVRPAIIHNHACWYGLILGFLYGAKRVETVHNIYHWMNWHERLRYGLYLRLAHRVIAVSEAVRQYTSKSFPFIQEWKFKVIYNGVNPELFAMRTDARETRASLGISHGEVVIGFFGRLTEQKGLHYLLDAIVILNARVERFRLLIVGEGDLQESLSEYARQQGIENILFTGYQQDVARYLHVADIVVLPSLWEGLPITLLEAMAAGRPVVATRVGGNAEVIEEGISGYLVEPRDPQQLSEALQKLLKDIDLRRQMGAAAQMRIQSHFSASSMIRQTEHVYAELLRSS